MECVAVTVTLIGRETGVNVRFALLSYMSDTCMYACCDQARDLDNDVCIVHRDVNDVNLHGTVLW